MTTWEFPCSEPIDANISLASGSATVTAAPTDVITVRVSRTRSGRPDNDDAASDVVVDFADRHLVISEPPRQGVSWRTRELHIAVTMPAGSRAAVQAASADVSCKGTYSAVDLRTASGRIDVENVTGPAEISTMSGGVQLGDAAEPTIETASGRIFVHHAHGDMRARTASGNIRISQADASVTARSASGKILINSLARGRADLTSVSGNIHARVTPGTGVYLDLASVTGRVTSDLAASDQEGDAELHLQCRTVSGSVHVASAVINEAGINEAVIDDMAAEAETMKQGS